MQRQDAIMNKPDYLSSTLVSDSLSAQNVYYTAENSIVDSIPFKANQALFVTAPTRSDGAGSITFDVPNDQLVSHVIMEFVLPLSVYNQVISGPSGWGYSLIKSYRWQIGSASQQQLDGQGLFMTQMIECDTEEKALGLLKAAGQTFSNTALSTQEDWDAIRRAYVVIELPHSITNYGSRKKPFDTSLLSSPIRLYVDLNPFNLVFRGAGLSALTQYDSINFLARQYRLDNNLDSLRVSLMNDSSLYYLYPFVLPQSAQYPLTFPIRATPSATSKVSFTVNGFRDAECLGIGMYIVRNINLSSGSFTFPLNTLSIKNIKMIYNGITYYYSPDQMFNVYNALDSLGQGYAMVSNTIDGADNLPLNIVMMNFCQWDPKDSESSRIQRGVRISANSLTVEVECAELLAASADCTAFLTFYYNASVKCQAGNATLVL